MNPTAIFWPLAFVIASTLAYLLIGRYLAHLEAKEAAKRPLEEHTKAVADLAARFVDIENKIRSESSLSALVPNQRAKR